MEYLNEMEKLLSPFKDLGFMEVNGTQLIGKAPHIAPKAWLHYLYSPLNEADILELERQMGINIPHDFRNFLFNWNGLKFFNSTLYIYGLRSNFRRDENANIQPFCILTSNKEERPKNANKDVLFIGGYKSDGTQVYINQEGIVFSCTRYDATPLKRWDSFELFLISELKRIIGLFDSKGQEIPPLAQV